MRFERGKDPKETMDIGIMSKLEKHGPKLLQRYHFRGMKEKDIKKLENEFEKLLGVPVEAIHKDNENSSSLQIRLR